MAAAANWKSRSLEVHLTKTDGDTVLTDQLVFDGLNQNGSLTGAFNIRDNLTEMTDYSDDGLKVIDLYELTDEA